MLIVHNVCHETRDRPFHERNEHSFSYKSFQIYRGFATRCSLHPSLSTIVTELETVSSCKFDVIYFSDAMMLLWLDVFIRNI